MSRWRNAWNAVMGHAPQSKASVEWPSAAPVGGRTLAIPASTPNVRNAIRWAMNLTPADLWKSQPYVRIVVPFIARNVAQLGLHTFLRAGDTDRRRLGPAESQVARILSKPNASTTAYRLIYGLVMDKCLYDRAYWLISRNAAGEWSLVRIPPAQITEHESDDLMGPIDRFIGYDARGRRLEIPGKRVLYFGGFNPLDPTGLPSSPLDSLKPVIAEQAAAFQFRQDTWEHGGQVGQTVNRPAEAPPWSKAARDRFLDDMRATYGKDAPQRGGIALLEDGMTLSSQQFNAHEAEWVEASKLSLSLVAGVYHINPTMVGVLDNANYSNVREFRRSLYGDSLGPMLADIEDEINTFLVPRFDETGLEYVEFNIAEKLQGSFEEQSTAMQTAVGGPWMTRAEARAVMNLASLPDDAGADELIVPLNVLIGGQASPTDSAPPAEPGSEPPVAEASRATVATKAARRVQTDLDLDEPRKTATEALSSFFARQGQVVKSKLGAKADGWWDQTRWDRELAAELDELGVATSVGVAAKVLEDLNFDPSLYDVDRTREILKAMAERIAGQINATTKAQLDDALGDADAVAYVFDVATTSRAEIAATTFVTTIAGFAVPEAAKQAAGERMSKVWVVNSRNPRPEHAAMDGETVPVDETFSNGAAWPGDQVLDVDQVAGCNCTVELIIED